MARITESKVRATLPAKDVEASRSFYEDKLGFKVLRQTPEQGYEFQVGDGSFYVFPSTGEPSGTHTQLTFDVDDVEEVVDDLTERGVTFEQYDMEGFKSDAKGLVDFQGEKGAWFKDPAGNLIALVKDVQ